MAEIVIWKAESTVSRGGALNSLITITHQSEHNMPAMSESQFCKISLCYHMVALLSFVFNYSCAGLALAPFVLVRGFTRSQFLLLAPPPGSGRSVLALFAGSGLFGPPLFSPLFCLSVFLSFSA